MISLIVLSFTLSGSALANFTPYMPPCAVKEIRSQIPYTLANFGHILYGRTIAGQLIIPNDTEFCSSDNSESFYGPDGGMKKFVLIRRGGCKFTKKILNAQKRGADMVIIYDNETSSSISVVMANDGHGHLIDIPSIFIGNSDGENILRAIQKCGESLIFKMTFDVFVMKTANVKFWIDASNRETFITIRDFFRDYYSVIKDQIDIDIRFKLLKNCGSEQCDSQSCIFNGKQFCLPERREGDHEIEGKSIVNEHLREYFLFQSLKEKKRIESWVEYMNEFDDQVCMEELDIKSCSNSVMSKYGDREAVEAKVRETYSNISRGQENVPEFMIQEAYKHDILFYPEVSINDKNFYGLFRAPDIFEMICQSLQDPPRHCHVFISSDCQQTFGRDDSEGLWATLLKILGCLMIGFLLALFAYTRLIKREINQHMSVEVNRLVEQYMTMTQEKSRPL